MVGHGTPDAGNAGGRRPPVTNLWHGILPAVILMAGFFIVPIAYTVGLSFVGADGAAPTLSNYATFFANDRFTDALARSVGMALTVVVLSSIVAYPLAYFLTYLCRRNGGSCCSSS